MLNDELIGQKYDSTFGAILNYSLLADCLNDLANKQGKDIGFIDLACGTGSLLKELRRKNPSIRLVGVDCEPKQLRAAREKESSAQYILADIFEPSSICHKIAGSFWMVHLGFAFLNRLSDMERELLLSAWGAELNVAMFVTEIWDFEFQHGNYKPNKEYITDTYAGKLISKHSVVDENEDRILVEFKFDNKGQSLISKAIMYRFPTQAVTTRLKSLGWRDYKVLPASYRPAKSHQLLLLER